MRGQAQIQQALGRGADEDHVAVKGTGIGAAVQYLPGGDEAFGLWFGVVQVHRSLRIHRDLQGAQGQLGQCPGFRRRFDQDVALAGGDAQGFQGQGRVQLVAQADDQRHPADDAVAIGGEGDCAGAGGGLFQGGQRAHALAQIGQGGQRIGAGKDETGLGCALRPRRLMAGGEAGDHTAARDGGGQYRVGIGQGLDGLAHGRRQRPIGRDAGRRRAVGLGQDDVERDGSRSGGAQAFHQSRQRVARPRPLSQLGQGFLVDIDDAHRYLHIGARPQVLQGVEGQMVQPGTRLRHQQQGEDGQHQGDGAKGSRPHLGLCLAGHGCCLMIVMPLYPPLEYHFHPVATVSQGNGLHTPPAWAGLIRPCQLLRGHKWPTGARLSPQCRVGNHHGAPHKSATGESLVQMNLMQRNKKTGPRTS